MNHPILSRNTYIFLFSLLGIVYIIGLFVPLMDNDSAHHANIALRMHLTGDYVTLIDHSGDYLDKPHFHFWLCAFSYKIFGVTSFAYKFPSFLFTIGGVYSVYRLGKTLYDHESGKLAALIIASAFAFILANNDVRMDALLTACVAFASWQGAAFINYKRIINAIGLAAGLAAGFCTKGHIAVFVPGVGLFFYILYKKDWRIFYNWKWLVVFFCFLLFISPVVYCYYLQYNMHPEKIVRGKNHINGVNFILFNQSVERFSGTMGSDSKKDYLFFVHSFLWAFAPWSFITCWALAGRIRNLFTGRSEWLTPSVILIMAVVVGLSGFKLPHYLNVVFPAAAVLTANWLLQNGKREKIIYRIQLFVAAVVLLLALVINGWFFPLRNFLIAAGLVILLAIVFHFIRTKLITLLQKSVCISVSVLILFFFLYNSNSSPQLLNYQCGLPLARQLENKTNTGDVYFLKGNYSSSFNFYTASLRKEFSDSLLHDGKTVRLFMYKKQQDEMRKAGYTIISEATAPDYEITRANLKFYNPATRSKTLDTAIIGAITLTH